MTDHEKLVALLERPTVEHAEKMGRDSALNGANTTNCHFSLFATPELMKAWERGRAIARAGK